MEIIPKAICLHVTRRAQLWVPTVELLRAAQNTARQDVSSWSTPAVRANTLFIGEGDGGLGYAWEGGGGKGHACEGGGGQGHAVEGDGGQGGA